MRNDKKLIFLFTPIVFTVIALCAGYCFSAQQLENLDASVGVNAVFTMSTNPASINFGRVDPGTSTDEQKMTISCVTNNNNPWNVSVRVLSEFTSGTFTIPNDKFNWRGQSTGSGRWNQGDGAMSATPFVFYEAGQNEYITMPKVDLDMYLKIDVPDGQAAGTYSTTLIFTMTE